MMTTSLLNTLLACGVALAIPGLINRVRARLAGRKGIRFRSEEHTSELQSPR